jgi:hypothetical protein
VDDYLKWGPLDKVSSFGFENYLGYCVKGRLSGSNKPLEQLCRHVAVENNRHVEKQYLDHVFLKNKILLRGKTQLKTGKIGDRDNCIMLKTGNIAILRTISGNNLTIDVMKSTPFFDEPVNSQFLGIYCTKLTGESKVINVEQIHCKMILIPQSKNFVAFKILHRI